MAIFVTSALVLAACVIDLLYLNPYWSLHATIPSSVFIVAAILGAVVGGYWALRVNGDKGGKGGKRIFAVLASVAVSIAAMAMVLAWIPRVDQFLSEPVAVAYQFTDRAVYRRVQAPNDERHPRYFLLRNQDVKVYDQFLVMVIDGNLGTYVNFNTLIPLGKR